MSAKTTPAALPIDAILPQLRAALAKAPVAVLQAPPGAGKSTRVPLALLAEDWLEGRRMIMLEPRRLAARATAKRMADMLGEKLGETVGYQIRFERRVSAGTRIEVVTEGILARRLQSDPELSDTGLVIFDEFHERHLSADLALALCRDVQQGLREDLKILLMSATFDGQALSRLLDDAPLISSEGRSFPVSIHHLSQHAQTPLPEAMATSIEQALAAHPGDLLAFLPGMHEIRRTRDLLESRLKDEDLRICALHGDLPQAEQDRALMPGPQRRVILATNIAETSLTIEGIRIVVDSGWARQPRFDPGSGMTRLLNGRISKASADQRAGRAGRLGPGDCYRLWGKDTHQGLLAQTAPEIRSADLAPLLLDLRLWGVRDPDSLTWLDPPPPAALAQAEALLQDLEALDDAGNITDAGRRMAALPLHPRLAHMILRAQALDLSATACDLAALLSERDIFPNPADGDLHDRLSALAAWRKDGQRGAQACRADAQACRRVDLAAGQWRRMLDCRNPDASIPEPDIIGLLLAFAYPDRIAQQRPQDPQRYLLAQGRGAKLSRRQGQQASAWLVAALVDAATGEALIHLAQSVSPALLRKHLADRIRVESRVEWDAQAEQIVARREEKLGELVLGSQMLDSPPPEAVMAALIAGIRAKGIEALPWTAAARQLQARLRFLREQGPDENWPDLDDASLLETLEIWLAPYLAGMRSLRALERLDLHDILAAQLDWPQRSRLEEGAPGQIAVPSGSQIRLDYLSGDAPVLAVKLQELFGLADTPRVAWGKVPVVLHLLSPARRPIQVTRDLKGFWERTYFEVRKELKGRYPRHPWPDDPWQATPTRGLARRQSSQ